MSKKSKFTLILIISFLTGCTNLPVTVTTITPAITKDAYTKLALCAVGKTDNPLLKDAWKQNAEDIKKLPDSQWGAVLATPSYTSLLETYSKLGCK